MNRAMFLVGLIFCISAINCENIQDIKVENLCPNDVFKFRSIYHGSKTYEVDTILRKQFNVTYNPIDLATIQTVFLRIPESFENRNHSARMIELARSFDRKIYEIYSDNYINNPQKFNNIENDFKLIQKLHSEIEHLRLNYMKSSIYSIKLGEKVNNGLDFVKSLYFASENRLESSGDRLKIIHDLIVKLKNISSNKELSHLKFALAELHQSELFTEYRIVQKNRFDFHKIAENFLFSHGTLYIDFVLPFQNMNYKKEEIKDCVKLDQLPKFYHRK